MFFKRLILILSSVLIITSPAYAVSVTAVGGVNWASPSQSFTSAPMTGVTVDTSSKLSYAFGAFIGVPVIQVLEIEAGALYKQNKYTGTATLLGTKFVDVTDSYKSIEVPVLVRFTGLPIVSFGAGGFFERGLGNVTSTNNLTSTTVDESFSDNGIKQTNYGVVFNVRAAFPIAPTLKAVIDGRYDLGLRELATATDTGFKTRNIIALAGVAFHF